MAESGKLIALEAIDDVAVGRLAEELCRWIRERGMAVEHTREPTYGPAGILLLLARQGRLTFDATSLALLYLADRLDHAQRVGGIGTWQAAGRHVICTHYRLAAEARLCGQVEWDWLHRIDSLSCTPDLTLYVDFPAQETRQDSLRAGYYAAIQRLRNEGQEIYVIDGATALEHLHLACKKHLACLLGLELSGPQ